MEVHPCIFKCLPGSDRVMECNCGTTVSTTWKLIFSKLKMILINMKMKVKCILTQAKNTMESGVWLQRICSAYYKLFTDGNGSSSTPFRTVQRGPLLYMDVLHVNENPGQMSCDHPALLLTCLSVTLPSLPPTC